MTDLNNLNHLTLPELEALNRKVLEVTRLKKEEARRMVMIQKRAVSEVVLQHRGMFLDLMKHGRTSCSDEKPLNGTLNDSGVPRCEKCALMLYSEHDLDDVAIEVEVRVRRVWTDTPDPL